MPQCGQTLPAVWRLHCREGRYGPVTAMVNLSTRPSPTVGLDARIGVSARCGGSSSPRSEVILPGPGSSGIHRDLDENQYFQPASDSESARARLRVPSPSLARASNLKMKASELEPDRVAQARASSVPQPGRPKSQPPSPPDSARPPRPGQPECQYPGRHDQDHDPGLGRAGPAPPPGPSPP
jgi:hypothetical protein